MSIYNNQPENRNFLSPLNFVFTIIKAPTVNFFAQKTNLPGLSISSTSQPNPFIKVAYSGEHIEFEDLKVTFKVDEDMKNYLEIYNWLKGLGKPEYFGQYKNLESSPSYSGNGIYSDVSLIILNSAKKPCFEVTYRDAFPVSLSGLEFDTTDRDINFLDATAVFKYTVHDIKPIVD